MHDSLRLFNCARCQQQVMLCGCCDRGNIYCGGLCSSLARKASLNSAGRQYQKTFKGAFHHAKRQKTYRHRKAKNNAIFKKVTHQGSPEPACNGLLTPAFKAPLARINGHCHFCGKKGSGFARIVFYKQRAPREKASFLAQGP